MRSFILIMTFSLLLLAQPAHNEQILALSGGDAVSLDRDWLFVGDVDNEKVNAYRLDYSTFQWSAQNFPSALKQGRFGASVMVDGDKMVVGAPDVETWRMEANTVTIQDTYANPNFTTVTLQRTYEEPPLIFALATKQGSDPSAVKITNRTNNSFDVVHAEPSPEDGPHVAMDISYFAIERGSHVLADGTHIYAGEIITRKVRRSNASGEDKGWETIVFPKAFGSQPMVLAEIQTMNNEINSVPTDPSEPWLTAAVRSVGVNGFQLTMDRSEVLTAEPVAVEETVAFLVMDVKAGTFSDINNTLIGFESIYSDDTIRGWDNGCYTTSFTQLFNNTPLVVATKDTLDGGDGGWLRRCSLSSSEVGLTVDEDRYQDSERAHTTERAGILAFSGPFVATFKAGEAYLYQYDSVSDAWVLKETIEPTIYSDDMKFGTSVALQSVGTVTCIAIGAPQASNPNSDTGKVFTYIYDGTQLVPGVSISGTTDEALYFGMRLDMKGEYLIVGAPDEQTSAGSADLVGAAYTFHFDGTNWSEYPSSGSYRIKVNNSDEKFASGVSINRDGNMTLISNTPTGATGQKAYRYVNDGSSWVTATAVLEKNGVDIDDGIHMVARGDSSENSFEFFDTLDSTSLFRSNLSTAVANAMDSVMLYKDQAIGNRPDNDDAAVIDIPCGIRPTYLKANVWAMVSVPCGDGTATVDALFGDDIGGSYGNSGAWVMYKDGADYTGSSGDAVVVGVNEVMEQGRGYWIIADHDVVLTADGDASAGTGVVTRTALDLSDPSSNRPQEVAGYYLFTLPQNIGYKTKIMVGNPMARVMSWRDVMVQDESDGSRAPIDAQGSLPGGEIVNPTAYVYDTTQVGQPYRAITPSGTPGVTDSIRPYQAFWVKKEVDVANAKLCLPFEK